MSSDWTQDERLLDEWRAGDERAARQLIERHIDVIGRFFRNKLSSGVEDLTQQTFLVLVEGREKIRSGRTIRAYLLTVAYRLLRAHLNDLAKNERVDFGITSMADIAPGPSSMLVQERRRTLLLTGLRQLPVDDQVALELAYWEGLNAAEIAEIVGISHSAMRSRMTKARKRLTEQLEGLSESEAQLRATREDLDKLERRASLA